MLLLHSDGLFMTFFTKSSNATDSEETVVGIIKWSPFMSYAGFWPLQGIIGSRLHSSSMFLFFNCMSLPFMNADTLNTVAMQCCACTFTLWLSAFHCTLKNTDILVFYFNSCFFRFKLISTTFQGTCRSFTGTTWRGLKPYPLLL